MKTFLQRLTLAFVVILAFSGSGCKKAESTKPSTISAAKEKHTKTKAHKRDKKEAKKANGGKKTKPATSEPAKPAAQ